VVEGAGPSDRNPKGHRRFESFLHRRAREQSSAPELEQGQSSAETLGGSAYGRTTHVSSSPTPARSGGTLVGRALPSCGGARLLTRTGSFNSIRRGPRGPFCLPGSWRHSRAQKGPRGRPGDRRLPGSGQPNTRAERSWRGTWGGSSTGEQRPCTPPTGVRLPSAPPLIPSSVAQW
jgi:hypothetical protein